MRASLAAADPTFWHLDATSWTAITALATAGLVITAVATAIYAVRQYGQGLAARDEARAAERAASRAYVVADFDRNPQIDYVIEFVVRNTGRSAARDVQFRWDPEPERAVKVEKPFMAARIFSGIPTLPPGREIRFLFDLTIDRYPRSDMPGAHSLIVEYTDIFGERHADLFILDADLYRDTHVVRTETIDDVGKALKTIADVLKQSGLGEGGGLRVLTRTLAEHQDAERQRYERFQQHNQPAPDAPAQAPASPAATRDARPTKYQGGITSAIRRARRAEQRRNFGARS